MVGSKPATEAGKSLDYEEQRLVRIAENKKRMEVSSRPQGLLIIHEYFLQYCGRLRWVCDAL
jgi:hypothetical protein